MKQQEELEAAVFKKFFHKKIKAMSCLKKFKYILLVLFFGGLIQGYFLLKNSLIDQIASSINESLDYYRILSSRDTYMSELIGVYRETIARNRSMEISSDQVLQDNNYTIVNSVEYFLQKTLDNEKLYN